jgi:inner membrane protein
MDSITHIVLGAVIGEAYAGKSIGKKALLFGAIFQTIPDFDIVASIFLDPTDNLLAHRGITHSLFFGILISLCAAGLFRQWKETLPLSFTKWSMFIGIEIAVHLLLDSLNNYGVGWFEPFALNRISFNVISIADPFVTIWPAIGFIVLLWLPSRHRLRTNWAVFGILLCGLYLCSSLFNKIQIDRSVEKNIADQNIEHTRYFTAPTLFNNLLWYCVVEEKAGYHIGYRSIFDKREQISFTWYPQQRDILHAIEDEKEVQNLIRFSQGYFTVERQPDAFVFNDLRFGRVAGWTSDSTEFTFHYYLQQPGKNMLVVQRGRFAEFNIRTLTALFDRIKGE